jgi:hypothetical protein
MLIHRYLSCLVAPAMLFFALSGAWQAYRMHETRKDGSYVAPAALELLSEVHMAEHLTARGKPWFRAGQLALAAAFAATAAIGVFVALRVARRRWSVWLCLAVGALIPLLLALGARRP